MSMRPPADRTTVITGATDGLGSALASELAASGATLVLHGRDDDRGRATIEAIREATGNERLEWQRADLGSLDEVAELGERIAAEHDRIDALVNNAGIGVTVPGGGARMESRDGHELRFAVNYLAHFALTMRLLPVLVGSAPARIVSVSSAGQAPIDFDDVMLEREYNGVQAYCQSKLAQVMMTIDLGAELRDAGVTANCLHPATYMPTKMVTRAGISPASSLEQGTAATLRVVADPDLDGVSGRYFDGEAESRAHPQAYDEGARRRLRELSERLVTATVPRSDG